MNARRLLGKPIQEAILEEVKAEVAAIRASGNRPPHLAAVLVGNDPASAIYVRTKTATCAAVGIDSHALTPSAETTTNELLELVHELNANNQVDGILIQLPLPSRIDTMAILDAVDPTKDVDGLHPESAGRLLQARPRFVPATPAGIIEMLDREDIEILGKNAVVIGRSEIVGKPMAALLMHRHATVTVCHSRTADLGKVTRGADILVSAVGVPGLVKPDMVNPGATVIDVGINRVSAREKLEQILGDAADWAKFDERGYLVVGDVHPGVFEVAGAMTPVPGGVGPLTIGMLLVNTLNAARERRAAARLLERA